MGLDCAILHSIDEADRNQWDNLVEQTVHGSLFHRYGWLKAIEAGLDSEPRHVVVSKDGNPVGVLPNFLQRVDLPVDSSVVEALPLRELVSTYPGYGGPLVATDREACLSALIDGIGDIGGPGVVNHRLRSSDPRFVEYGKSLRAVGYRPEILTCRVEVRLERGWPAIEAGMAKERRNALRQARGQSWKVDERALGDGTLDRVYAAYESNMDRVGGTTFPRSFFDAIADELGEHARVFTASVEGDRRGAFVYLVDPDGSTIHYFFSAIDDEEDYRYYPADLLHAHVMQWGIDRGFQRYDFGETPADFSDGLFRYKRKYGGELHPTIQWRRGESRLGWFLYRAGESIYRKFRDGTA